MATRKAPTSERVLARARKLIAAGKVKLSPTVPASGRVKVRGWPRGLAFSWNRPGIGFGEFAMWMEGDRFVTDREGMGVQFCLDVVRQALEEEKGHGAEPKPSGH